MGFGGGATPSDSIPGTVDTALSLLLLGHDKEEEEDNSWADSITNANVSKGFSTDPSLLRWISAIGLTDSGGNPYSNFAIYNPTSTMRSYRQAIDRLYNLSLDSNQYTSDYLLGKSLFDGTIGKIDVEDFISQAGSIASPDVSSAFNDMISSLPADVFDDIIERASEGIRARQVVRKENARRELNERYGFNGMARSSGVIIGASIIEREFESEIIAGESQAFIPLYQQAMGDFFRGILELLREYTRTMVITRSQDHERAVRYQQILQQDRVSRIQIAQLYGASVGQEIQALSGYNSNVLETKVQETLWDPEILQFAANATAAFSGAAIPTPRPSKGQIALSAALQIAAIGTQFFGGAPPGADGFGSGGGFF